MNSNAFKDGLNIYATKKSNMDSWTKFLSYLPKNQRANFLTNKDPHDALKSWLISEMQKKNSSANKTNLNAAAGRLRLKLKIESLKKMYPKFVKFIELLKMYAPRATPQLNVGNITYNRFDNKIWISLHVKGKPDTYLQLAPKNKNTIGFNYGETNENNRGKGWGTTIRTVASNTAHRAGMRVVQLPKNLENLVAGQGTLPPSAGIMRKLGGVTFKNNKGLLWFEVPAHATRSVSARKLKNNATYAFPTLKQKR